MSRGYILLSYQDKKKPVLAELCGNFVIHRDGDWCVSHKNSGLLLIKLKTRETARKFVKEFKALNIDCSMFLPENRYKHLSSARTKNRKIVREFIKNFGDGE